MSATTHTRDRDSDVNRYERELLRIDGPVGAYARQLAAASRQTRSSFRVAQESESALVEVAVGVAVPFLVSYVSWLLARAQQQGVERLYFLARDGQVLHQIAEAIAPRLRVKCDLQYLQVSRVTLNLAAAFQLTDESLAWSLTGLRRQSVTSLCERLHLDPEELADTLLGYGVTRDRWDAPLERTGAQKMQTVLREASSRELLGRRAAEVRERTMPYLSTARFLDPGRVGIVDLGGAGSQLCALGAFRDHAGLARPVGFLIYRERSALKEQDRGGITSGCSGLNVYLAGDEKVGGGPLITGVVPLLEAFCAADHGRVIDYQVSPSSVDAVTERDFGPALQRWGLTLVRAAMGEAVSHLVRRGAPEACNEDLLPTLAANLQTFIRYPTLEEARAWGSFPVGITKSGQISTLAPTITVGAIKRVLKARQSLGSLSHWWPASLARTPRYLRLALAAVIFTRRLRQKLVGRSHPA